jgi:hypothetical protein
VAHRSHYLIARAPPAAPSSRSFSRPSPGTPG